MYNKPISTDFTGTNEFSLPPEGRTEVEVLDVYPYVAKSGKDNVVFELATSDGFKLKHYCFNDVDDSGKTNRWMLKKTLGAITGVAQPTGPVSFYPRDIVGKKFFVVIKHEEFIGTSGRAFKNAKIADVIVDEAVASGQTNLEKDESDLLPF